MNARHRNLHSSVRRRNYAVVILMMLATEGPGFDSSYQEYSFHKNPMF